MVKKLQIWTHPETTFGARRFVFSPELRRKIQEAKSMPINAVNARVDALTEIVEALELRVDALEGATAPPVDPPIDPPVDPPVDPPPPGSARVRPEPPAVAEPFNTLVVRSGTDSINAQSNFRYEIEGGAHLPAIHIGAGVENVLITGPGSVGSVMGWYSENMPRRVTIRQLEFFQLYAHISDLSVIGCRIENRGEGLGGDGYAVWSSQFQRASRTRRTLFQDCRFFSGDPNVANGCIRIEDAEDLHFLNCTMDSSNHRGLRLHGNQSRVLVEGCTISRSTRSALGGVYATPHGGQGGFAEQMQFLRCDITHSLQIDPDNPATQLDTSTLWVNGCTLRGFDSVENINQAESDWVSV